MPDVRLLKIIDALADDYGCAEVQRVGAAYGVDFQRAINDAYIQGHVTYQQAPIGSVRITSDARMLARR